MFSKEKIKYFKEKLEKERERLEKGLEYVAKKSSKIAGDWEVSLGDLNIETSDKNELADVFEELETHAAIEDKLEEGLTLVNQALGRIKRGTYGICHSCKNSIEEKRLEANLVAKNCIKHAGQS
ncbi:MAG: TraR/DksA family transcriptional regulator [Candidatus Terrybacteria bacterium]|nr:TraR/DksA family transcriptional regulator [Candidatus Terrybacteria bacterium]